MAKFSFRMPDDFLRKLSTLGSSTDHVVEEVLKAGADVVEKEVKESLTSVIGKDTKKPSRSSGQLINALGTSQVMQDRSGAFNIKVGFQENRGDGTSNSMIASVIEYGKSNQKAKPFIKPALKRCKDEVISAMERKLDEEIAKL